MLMVPDPWKHPPHASSLIVIAQAYDPFRAGMAERIQLGGPSECSMPGAGLGLHTECDEVSGLGFDDGRAHVQARSGCHDQSIAVSSQ
jgi:hypothetical protein